jgi:hypothetical protein
MNQATSPKRNRPIKSWALRLLVFGLASWLATKWIKEPQGVLLVGIWCTITLEVLYRFESVRRLLAGLDNLHSKLASASPFFESLRLLPHVDRYTTLLSKHADLQHLSPTLSLALDYVLETFHREGLAVVGATNGKYLRVLEDALYHAERSFEAILTRKYPPWWFFENPDNEEPTLDDRRAYLAQVRNATGIERKTRLLVYDWDANPTGTPFRNEFVEKMSLVERFLDEAGAFETDPQRGHVEHYLFDWDGHKTYEKAHGPAGPFAPLFGEVDRVLKIGQDFAVMDRSLVVMKTTEDCLQVVPLQQPEEDYTLLFREFRDPIGPGDRFWIYLDKSFLAACSCAEKLLSKVQYEEHIRNCETCGARATGLPLVHPPRGPLVSKG